MPRAKAPKAPCVDVWLSPHTIVMPGCVKPCSGAMTWTIPWRGLLMSYSSMPNSAQFAERASSCFLAISSVIGSERSQVGVLWSAVATVRSVRRTPRPAIRRPSNAWGDVTSWTR